MSGGVKSEEAEFLTKVVDLTIEARRIGIKDTAVTGAFAGALVMFAKSSGAQLSMVKQLVEDVWDGASEI